MTAPHPAHEATPLSTARTAVIPEACTKDLDDSQGRGARASRWDEY
jgi:hypothetical protein